MASTRAIMSEPGNEAYAATKGGLVALAHALAMTLGPDIRVNCVSPGWIMTGDYASLRRKDHFQHPAGRVGKPQDIAEMVAFLLDRERSGFVTGANFMSYMAGHRDANVGSDIAPDALFASIEQYCKQNPSQGVHAALEGAYSQLAARR